MSRPTDRASERRALFVAVVIGLAVAIGSSGCDGLDARGKVRKGNRLYRDTRFVDAAALYEGAMKNVNDERVEYNLGLAYSKIFRPGLDEAILLAEKGSSICDAIPEVTYVKRRVCVKNDPDEEDRGYNKCDERAICPSSATCTQTELCAKENPALANLSAKHLLIWIEKQPPDDELKTKLKAQNEQLEKMEIEHEKFAGMIDAAILKDDKEAEDEATQKKTKLEELIKILKGEIEETQLKFTMRKLVTQLWLDSQQFDNALAFWTEQLKAKPNDPEVMGNIAGINLKAGDWRKSIEWYSKVAEASTETTGKVTAYSFIGNVAWSKLNSKTLKSDEAVELADLGIGSLQKAATLAPKNLTFLRLQSSLLNFRSLVHGASWAAAIDRASAQDLKGFTDVQSGAKPPVPPPPPPTPTSPSMSGAPAEKSGG